MFTLASSSVQPQWHFPFCLPFRRLISHAGLLVARLVKVPAVEGLTFHSHYRESLVSAVQVADELHQPLSGLAVQILSCLVPTVAPHKHCCLLCRWLISHTSLFVAWLFNMAYSLALVYLATWTVVSVAPQAAGAGVAEVTAYLNGCSLPKVGRCAT